MKKVRNTAGAEFLRGRMKMNKILQMESFREIKTCLVSVHVFAVIVNEK